MWPIYVINNNGAKIRDFYGLFGEWPRFQVLSFRLLSFIPKKIERKWGGARANPCDIQDERKGFREIQALSTSLAQNPVPKEIHR
jgi:hypothetical protein